MTKVQGSTIARKPYRAPSYYDGYEEDLRIALAQERAEREANEANTYQFPLGVTTYMGNDSPDEKPEKLPQWAWDALLLFVFVVVAWGTAQSGLLYAFGAATFGVVMSLIHPPIRKFIQG